MIADSAVMMIQYGNKEMLCGNIPPSTASRDVLTFWFANLTNSFWGTSFGSNCFYDTQCLRDDPSQYVDAVFRVAAAATAAATTFL
jgi:hypothetical protein